MPPRFSKKGQLNADEVHNMPTLLKAYSKYCPMIIARRVIMRTNAGTLSSTSPLLPPTLSLPLPPYPSLSLGYPASHEQD